MFHFSDHQHITSMSESILYWNYDSSLSVPKATFGAVVLEDRRVMICGGVNDTFAETGTCGFYGSSTGWIAGPRMNVDRYLYTLTPFANNTKLLAGGIRQSGSETAEIYNSLQDTWPFTARMSTCRRSHAAILLNNERILIISGKRNLDVVLSSTEIFIPSSNSFILTNSLNEGRALCTCTLLSFIYRIYGS